MISDRLYYEFDFEFPENFAEKYLLAESISEEFSSSEYSSEIENGVPAELTAPSKCHQISLVKKSKESNLKLLIKIFADKNSTFNDISTQTKNKETRNERIQTHADVISCRVQTETNVQNCRTQTPMIMYIDTDAQTSLVTFADTEIQTTFVSYNDTDIQTDESRLHQAFSDVQISTDCNLLTQVDASLQTVTETVDNSCQNVALTNELEVQTDLDVNDGESQTEIKDYSVTEVQTTCSIANACDVELQATVDISETHTQMEAIDVKDNKSQTDLSYFFKQEAEIQATVLSITNDSQTELNIGEQSTITECNSSTQRHTGIQSFIELNTQSQQTDSCKDEIIPALNETIPEFGRSLAHGDQTISSTHSLSDLRTHNDSTFFDSSYDVGDVANQTIKSKMNGSMEPSNPNLVDGISQTDPVTIIIGDASFLVQKLKSSAVSSSKVTTSGNEIEIELSADTVDAAEEKNQQTNKPQKQAEAKPETVQQMPKLTPMRAGGVRMRLPVSMPNTNVNPVKSSPAPRIPSQPPIVAPSPQLQPKIQQPAKISNDIFSCPFCSLNFIESPALYEHLSQAHESDLQSKWKKSQGREGKTIIPKHLQKPKNPPKKTNTSKPNSNSKMDESDDSDASFTLPGTKRKKVPTNTSKKHKKAKNEDDDDED